MMCVSCLTGCLCPQPGGRPHQLREVLAAGQAGDGVYRMETGGVSVCQGEQGDPVPDDGARL